MLPQSWDCYDEDERAGLGRVFVFHGIKFTAMFWKMVLLTYGDRTTAQPLCCGDRTAMLRLQIEMPGLAPASG